MRQAWKITGFTVVLAILLLFCLPAVTEDYKYVDTGSRIIVSLGDSYSSGEGIEPFYDQELHVTEKVKSADWVAHRSKMSWPSMLNLSGNSMFRNWNWFFVAASGAETKHFNTPQRIDYNRGLDVSTVSIVKGYTMLDPQLDIFDVVESKGLKADYVTMTIGGNDVDFAGIIATAAQNSVYTNPNAVYDKVDLIWKKFNHMGGVRDSLINAYHAVAEKAGDQAEIIVAGYPKLISPMGYRWFFDRCEANFLNEQVTKFNRRIEDLVEKCAAEGLHIYFVPVEPEFSGHEAYTDDPYINPIYLLPQDQDLNWRKIDGSPYSIHPNEEGAKAYARCVQAKIDWLENQKRKKLLNPVTPEPPVSVSESIPESEPAGEELRDGMWFFRMLTDGTAEITDAGIGYDDRSGFSIPEEVVINRNQEKAKVTSIGPAAFKSCPISFVSIPESVTTIKSEAFFGCGYPPDSEYDNFRILIPESVVYIADDAFNIKPSITIITYPGTYAAAYCERLGIQCEIREKK